jgi:N-acetylneuraminic acid mutarotase
VRNTIIANNTAADGSFLDLSGNLTSDDYNLITIPAGGAVSGTTTHNLTNVNPLLGPLNSNGGRTMTHALLAGSPAINAGNNALALDQSNVPLTSDQRGAGFARIQNGTVDIGAFESALLPTPSCSDDLWAATSVGASTPVARRFHTTVWTGTEMIVWGGQGPNASAINTGARYNPATDTWTPITTTNAPSARFYHSAVWTGTEMIVWGGVADGFVGLIDGARYNPATDKWTPISNVNAPTGRPLNTVVWTGKEMIIWGGSPNNGFTNTGARYNPATDTWTTTTITNAPIARGYHTAVWTGSEMIVWGGSNGALLATGGRYNPTTDTWTPTGMTNVPSARADFTAVWTGTEMIVWGGGTNTGARYNPLTDKWIAISILGAPTARAQQIAVWTGSEMIIWSGDDRNQKIGGRYNPGTDTWIQTCDVTAPSGRVYATAVWTGTQMIVWGGEDVGFQRLNTGGRYSLPGRNQIDSAIFFVRRQYLDFLNREPDPAGWDFWTQEISSCGLDPNCIEVKRIHVSAAFFLSIEFQQTGNLVYKMYKAGFGNLSTTIPVAVDRANFLADTTQIQSTPAQVIVGQGNWQAQLDANKQAFALAFVQRPAFQTIHANQSVDQYVTSLFANTFTPPTPAETTAAVNAFNAAGGGDPGRAAALRSVAESNSVSVKLNNEAFVLMEYFGYLQRNPNDPPETSLDYSGYNFWLGKLNQFNGDFIAAEMVKAFISSSEYRHRFGP